MVVAQHSHSHNQLLVRELGRSVPTYYLICRYRKKWGVFLHEKHVFCSDVVSRLPIFLVFRSEKTAGDSWDLGKLIISIIIHYKH
jgi:hypothetical protein